MAMSTARSAAAYFTQGTCWRACVFTSRIVTKLERTFCHVSPCDHRFRCIGSRRYASPGTPGRSPTTGAPIETLTSQSIVNVADLNLRTPAGRDELAARISAAAGRACDWLDEVYPASPTTTPPTAECRSEAIKRAQSQVDAAIALANR